MWARQLNCIDFHSTTRKIRSYSGYNGYCDCLNFSGFMTYIFITRPVSHCLYADVCLIDKVTLLYEGCQTYFGPIKASKQFLVDLVLICADLATTAEFLRSLTNPAHRNLRRDYELRVPQRQRVLSMYGRLVPIAHDWCKRPKTPSRSFSKKRRSY